MLVTNAADYFFFLGIKTYFSQQMYLKTVRLIIAIWLTKGIVCQRIAEIGSLLKSYNSFCFSLYMLENSDILWICIFKKMYLVLKNIIKFC